MMNFYQIFRKNLSYDNIKSHQKSGLHALSRKHNFGKITGRECQIDPTTFVGLERTFNTTDRRLDTIKIFLNCFSPFYVYTYLKFFSNW